jgi:hypothetical protein
MPLKNKTGSPIKKQAGQIEDKKTDSPGWTELWTCGLCG